MKSFVARVFKLHCNAIKLGRATGLGSRKARQHACADLPFAIGYAWLATTVLSCVGPYKRAKLTKEKNRNYHTSKLQFQKYQTFRIFFFKNQVRKVLSFLKL